MGAFEARTCKFGDVETGDPASRLLTEARRLPQGSTTVFSADALEVLGRAKGSRSRRRLVERATQLKKKTTRFDLRVLKGEDCSPAAERCFALARASRSARNLSLSLVCAASHPAGVCTHCRWFRFCSMSLVHVR